GFPLLSGFWSKDEILSAVSSAATEGHPYRAVYVLLLIAGLVTAGLTAFYTFRAYFLTFEGELRTPPEAGHHVHESPPVMVVPLMILAIGALLIGFVVQIEPFPHGFSHFLAQTPFFAPVHEHEWNWTMMAGSSVIALGGIGVAWFMYVVQPGFAAR